MWSYRWTSHPQTATGPDREFSLVSVDGTTCNVPKIHYVMLPLNNAAEAPGMTIEWQGRNCAGLVNIFGATAVSGMNCSAVSCCFGVWGCTVLHCPLLFRLPGGLSCTYGPNRSFPVRCAPCSCRKEIFAKRGSFYACHWVTAEEERKGGRDGEQKREMEGRCLVQVWIPNWTHIHDSVAMQSHNEIIWLHVKLQLKKLIT